MTNQEIEDKLIGATLVITHQNGEITKSIIADIEWTDINYHAVYFKNCTVPRYFPKEALEFWIQGRTVEEDDERFYLETQEEKIDWEVRAWQLAHDLHLTGVAHDLYLTNKTDIKETIRAAHCFVDEYRKYMEQLKVSVENI